MVIHLSCMCIIYNVEIDRFVCFRCMCVFLVVVLLVVLFSCSFHFVYSFVRRCQLLLLLLLLSPCDLHHCYCAFFFVSFLPLCFFTSYIFNACLSVIIICLLFLFLLALFSLLFRTLKCNSKCMACASCAEAPKLFRFVLLLVPLPVLLCLLHLLPAHFQMAIRQHEESSL